MPDGKLVAEMLPRDTNNREIFSTLASIGRKHILMARSVAEAPNHLKNRLKSSNSAK